MRCSFLFACRPPSGWGRPLALLVALVGAGSTRAAPPPVIDISAVPMIAAPSRLPPHWHRGAFMEIFVRAYQDSDGDGVGDLRGLISRLDYLKDLGVKGLWLMPVTKSGDGDHGYATTDYRDIEPAYGTLADFDELLAQAHRRGIGVVMDYVLNHAAASHPMFIEALKGPGNPFNSWFVWSQQAPQGWDIWGKNPWYHTAAEPWNFKGDIKAMPPPPADATGFYFGTFGPHMPDFNFRNAAVVAYHENSLRFWLNRGLDGYRLDAVPHLVENGAIDWNDQPQSRRITKKVQGLIRRYPRRYVVCEATAKPQDYGSSALCGGAFAFGYVQHFVRAALGEPESVRELARFYNSASPNMATFVSNHDIFAGRRLWDQVGGDEAKYKLAAAGYLLQPGTPFIYYGEELGQAGVRDLYGDMPLRAPMSWATSGDKQHGFTTGEPFRPLAPNLATHNAASQQHDPNSILGFYKAMLKLRNERASIARGSFKQPFAEGMVLGFKRRLGRERTLVLINYGATPVALGPKHLSPGTVLRPLYPAGGAAMRVGADGSPLLPAQSVHVFDLR
jgi:glycosidase